MKDALYGGVNVAVLTAMRPELQRPDFQRMDLSIDLDRMAAHCRWLLAQGANGLGVLGTTGEANSLGISERLHLMEGLVERGLPAEKMLPGVGVPALTDTLAMARRAAELGCRGALVLPPFFYKNPSEDGLFAYYSEIAQRLGGALKIYFYHFPAQSAVPITVPLIARLLRAHPGAFQGLKDSTGDWSNTKSYIDHFAADGFEVYSGDDSHLLQNLQAGGAGSISAASNVSAATNAQVYATWDQPTATDAQTRLTAMRSAVTSAPLIPGLKSLVARHTGESDWETVRPPHTKLTADQRAKLFATFDACGNPLAAARPSIASSNTPGPSTRKASSTAPN